MLGRAFGETAALITEVGDWTDDHVWQATESETTLRVATAPETRERLLFEGGTRLRAVRMFWVAHDMRDVNTGHTARVDAVTQISEGDKLRYDGEVWRVQEATNWGTFSEVSAVRVEKQAVPTRD